MSNGKNSISGRSMLKKSLLGAAIWASAPAPVLSAAQRKANPIRLGGPVFGKFDGPHAWARAVKDLGYSAAYCPVGAAEKDDVVSAYADAAKNAGIVIAEVGAWSNPISPDEKERSDAQEKCSKQLT